MLPLAAAPVDQRKGASVGDGAPFRPVMSIRVKWKFLVPGAVPINFRNQGMRQIK
jgi:hypothetical protein